MLVWFYAAMSFFADEHGQDTFEYVLVIGAIVVAMTIALLGFTVIVPQVLGYACPSVDTSVNPIATIGSCLGS